MNTDEGAGVSAFPVVNGRFIPTDGRTRQLAWESFVDTYRRSPRLGVLQAIGAAAIVLALIGLVLGPRTQLASLVVLVVLVGPVVIWPVDLLRRRRRDADGAYETGYEYTSRFGPSGLEIVGAGSTRSFPYDELSGVVARKTVTVLVGRDRRLTYVLPNELFPHSLVEQFNKLITAPNPAAREP